MLTSTHVLSGIPLDEHEEVGRPAWATPMLALWGAVFARAVEDWYEGCRRGFHVGENIPKRIGRRGVVFTYEDFTSAQRWLFSDEGNPGSFKWVCDVLDFDPEIIRSQLYSASAYRELKRRVQ